MPASRRRSRSHVSRSNLPIRVTSYRRSDAQSLAPSSTHSGFPDRAAILARLKTSQKHCLLQGPTGTFQVTAERLSLTLPVPPSINHQYATVNGRRLLSSAGRAYKTQVAQQIWVALAQSSARNSLMERLHADHLALSIRFFFTSALRRDVDGGLKIAQDALCEGLGLNDNRIIETHLYKSVDKSHPRIEVSLAPASATSSKPLVID